MAPTEPREHGLLMKGPLVLQTMRGRKTETRRVPTGRYLKWRKGDLVWVRETFYCDDYRYPDGPVTEMREALEFRADHNCAAWEAGCPCRNDDGRSSWKPSIHMFKWAARLWLELTEDTRYEPLQEIRPCDVLAEGLHPEGYVITEAGLIADFAALWDEINGHRGPKGDPHAYSWARNPEVAVLRYRVASTTGRPISKTTSGTGDDLGIDPGVAKRFVEAFISVHAPKDPGQ